MLQQVLANIFLVVCNTLGFMSVYTQIDSGTKKRVAKQRSLSPMAREMPLVIYICAVLVLLRVISTGFTGMIYWVFLNLQVTILVYSNLLLTSIPGFLAVQATGAVVFASTGEMNWYSWLLFLVAGAGVFTERWYGPHFKRYRFLYLVPAAVIGIAVWIVVALRYPHELSTEAFIVNIISFMWAYFALWDYDLYQRQDQKVLAKLTHAVQYDGLTQVRNWSTFQEDFNEAYHAGGDLALLTMDIDHFKRINDTYGHLVGNQALMVVSTALSSCLKEHYPKGAVYRTGGEEFAIILPNVTLDTATQLVLDFQKGLRRAKIRSTRGEFLISASFGVTMLNEKDENATAVFKRADQYLYQSKHLGRNCVTVEGKTMTAFE